VAVFLPMLFWPGVIGEFMSWMPLTLIITLICSLFVAIIINPVITGIFVRLESEKKQERPRLVRIVTAVGIVLLAGVLALANWQTLVFFAVAIPVLYLLHTRIFKPIGDDFVQDGLPKLVERYRRMLRWMLKRDYSVKRAMLRNAGVAIELAPARIDEAALRAAMLAEGAPPRDIADKLAELKALRASQRHPGRLVLGADQVLVADGTLHAKPASRDEARAQLRALRGRTHRLLSAAVIVDTGTPVWRHVGTARLTMRPFSDAFLEDYLERMGDLAFASVGCYQLEGLGAQLFARVDGDFFTVLGLPLLETLGYLRARGVLLE